MSEGVKASKILEPTLYLKLTLENCEKSILS